MLTIEDTIHAISVMGIIIKSLEHFQFHLLWALAYATFSRATEGSIPNLSAIA